MHRAYHTTYTLFHALAPRLPPTQAAVPKFVKLTLGQASASSVARGSPVTQLVKVENSQHGVKPLALRVKVTYILPGGESVVEQFDFKSFPSGF